MVQNERLRQKQKLWHNLFFLFTYNPDILYYNVMQIDYIFDFRCRNPWFMGTGVLVTKDLTEQKYFHLKLKT